MDDQAESAAGSEAGPLGAADGPTGPTGPAGFLTRRRLLTAGAATAAVVAACVLVLSSGGKSDSATNPGPAVNPQAQNPIVNIESPYATGVHSVLTDDALRAAVPGCGSCKLVTRANGFSPDGDVLVLFRTGEPVAGQENFKLVVVSPDAKVVWSAPSGMQALSAGFERFTEDQAGNFYLAMPGAVSGQIMVALTYRNGQVVDLGGLTAPKVSGQIDVGILPQATTSPTATIVAQSKDGVPDATTGGLIESQYQIRDGAPVLIGCRRRVGESGQWITYQPDSHACADYPPGPVGPPDSGGDDQ